MNGNLEQLEHGDDRRLERRDAVDALAHVEGEVELSAAQLLDPLAVVVDGNADDLVPLGDERRSIASTVPRMSWSGLVAYADAPSKRMATFMRPSVWSAPVPDGAA